MRPERARPPSLLLLSNGHGEDAVAARVAAALARRRVDLRMTALPLVGLGEQYAQAGIELLEPRRALPSGGLLMHALPLLLADLRAGFVGLSVGQVRRLARLQVDLLLVVGDIYAQLLGMLVSRRQAFLVQTLVSVHHAAYAGLPPPNRLFMERLTLPERLLMRSYAGAVYTRDAVTAAELRRRGVGHARYLGNPMTDGLEGRPPVELAGRQVVALLPGSRAYATRSLAVMLSALERTPSAVVGAVAWAGGALEVPGGWELHQPAPGCRSLLGILRRGQREVLVYRGRFADVVRAAVVAIGTSGTAHEQAAALGRPVVAFPLPPHYSPAFLANQKRLLGMALEIVEPHPHAIATAVRLLLEHPERRAQAAAVGRARMGEPGGSEAIAADILARSGC